MAKKKVQIVIFKSSDGSCQKITHVLLLKTNRQRGQFWQNVTGSVENDESFLASALREVQEETQLQINQEILKKIEVEYFFIDRKKRKVHEKVYTFITDQDQIRISEEEHTEYRWQAIDDINEQSYLYYTNYDAFSKALKFWQS